MSSRTAKAVYNYSQPPTNLPKIQLTKEQVSKHIKLCQQLVEFSTIRIVKLVSEHFPAKTRQVQAATNTAAENKYRISV